MLNINGKSKHFHRKNPPSSAERDSEKSCCAAPFSKSSIILLHPLRETGAADDITLGLLKIQ